MRENIPRRDDLEPLIHGFGALIFIVLLLGLLVWAIGALIVVGFWQLTF